MDSEKHYFTFASTRLFIQALALVEQANIPSRVVPMPDRFSNRCGMVIEARTPAVVPIRQLLEEAGLAFDLKH